MQNDGTITFLNNLLIKLVLRLTIK